MIREYPVRFCERLGVKFPHSTRRNVYVKTQKAGERVMASLTEFLGKRLKLRVNQEKSAVAETSDRQFLGYRITAEGKLCLSPKSLKRAKDRIRQITRRNQSNNLEHVIKRLNAYLLGWGNYFKLTDNVYVQRDLDSWIRRKLRCYRLKQRKRKWAIAKFLIRQGVPELSAWITAVSGKGWWRLSACPASHQGMRNSWFLELGLTNLEQRHLKLKAV